MSSTMFGEFDDLLCLSEEEIRQVMMSLQPLPHPPMALDGLSNTTNGGPAARSHADAVPPVAQQGHTSTTAADEAQPGGGWAWLDLSLVDEVQIQQMTPTISPSQPFSSPVINPPGPYEANHAASAPMASQAKTLIPVAPHDQEVSRASTRRRSIKSRGLPSRQQDGSGNVFGMGMDMIRQLGRHIGKTMKEEKQRSIVWQHFWRSYCKYCDTVTVICQYCNTLMRHLSTIEMLRHLESFHNIHLLPASSGTSKETQRSSEALQITQIVENPNGESESIEIDNSNCATAARVDTQGTNAVVWEQHQLLMDREEQMSTILSSQPCCNGHETQLYVGRVKYSVALDDPDLWWDLMIRLSESSCCSSTTKSTHDGFRLKFCKEKACKIHVHTSSAAWNPYKDYAGVVLLETFSHTIDSSYLLVEVSDKWVSTPAGCAYAWQCMHIVLCSLGFRKEFATNLVIYALGWVDGCNLRLRSPHSSNKKGKSIIVEEGVVSSGKRKRKPAPPRSKVWNHFTKKVVEAEGGSRATMAKCNYCPSELKANSASHGTTHLKRHIISIHPEHAKSL